MYSARVKETVKETVKEVIEAGPPDLLEVVLEQWRGFPASTISHHGEQCCHIAREWILSTDHSQLNAGSRLMGPRWLLQKYTWGPSSWPIHWCEAVERKTLDCGALAALSHEVFAARGVTSYPTQIIQQFSRDATGHWRKKWEANKVLVKWINEDLIYHEGCAVAAGESGEIKVWDSSDGCWMNPKQFEGYGRVLALRVFADSRESSDGFIWGTHRIIPNQWQRIERARADFS